ncbi:MAG: iron ABC transporter permease [Oscillospiraceae bacterium]|jgi:iron complex transport system permease protein|nr:iron ABC transporter permease [Oscillospiraceae bacterium]
MRGNKQKAREGFNPAVYLLFAAVTFAVFILCVAVGSVNIPISELLMSTIITGVRLPRVISCALVGASLAVCGCAMQGLLKNPLADASTLGVSAGAGLGAVTAIAFGITLPALPFAGTTIMASLFAFISLLAILTLAYTIDRTLATNTIILIGVIFSMFVSALMSILITFAGEKANHMIFWTMGSLSGSGYNNALLLAVTLVIFGGLLVALSRELNAFAIGEENARHIGVNVKRVKLLVLIATSVLIGVCVSIGGTIAFVGLVTPHMVRMITGPNHKRLMPASVFGGAVFLMLCDLVSRTAFSPRELPIGVVTSLVGAVLFVRIFYAARRG